MTRLGFSLFDALLPILLGSAVAATTNSNSTITSTGFPSSLVLKASVLTHAEPFAMRNAETFVYSGLQPDLLDRIKIFAANDGVTLDIILEEAPMYSYVASYQQLSENCNTTENPQPRELCHQYDLLIGDFYTNPDRAMQVDFTPPFLRTAVSAIKYFGSDNVRFRDITTLSEASRANATICVVYDSYMDGVAMERYPDATYFKCTNQDDCVDRLKASECALFVDDELQLRYRAVADPSLVVTQENFNSQFIAWPLRYNLEPTTAKLLKRWMYAAKSNATLDELYDKYFSINLCPLGFAGPNCDDPCDPSHGRSDRLGNCVCESTKWAGADCSIEVVEDTNGIPTVLVWIGYGMVVVNFCAIFICATWLYVYRASPQVTVVQPFFLFLVLLGCLISTSTIIPMAQENTDGNPKEDTFWSVHTACMLIPWTYSVGFSITFGTLFAKIRRVHVMFQAAAEMRRISISIKETVMIIGVVLALDVAILTVWTVVDPLQWERTVLTADKYGNALSSEGHCTCEWWALFGGLIALLHFVLLGVASYLCYVTRNIPTKFSEGKYVAIAMISNLQIFVMGVPVLIIMGSDPQSSFFVRSIIVWMNDLVVLMCIFGNLMYSVWHDAKKGIDSRAALRTSAQEFARTSRLSRNSGTGGTSKVARSQFSYESEMDVVLEGSEEDTSSHEVDLPRPPEIQMEEEAPRPKREVANSWAMMAFQSSVADPLGDISESEKSTVSTDPKELTAEDPGNAPYNSSGISKNTARYFNELCDSD